MSAEIPKPPEAPPLLTRGLYRTMWWKLDERWHEWLHHDLSQPEYYRRAVVANRLVPAIFFYLNVVVAGALVTHRSGFHWFILARMAIVMTLLNLVFRRFNEKALKRMNLRMQGFNPDGTPSDRRIGRLSNRWRVAMAASGAIWTFVIAIRVSKRF